MTHDELLAKLADNYQIADYAELRDEQGFLPTHQALRAVVELHTPIYRGCDDDRCCGSSDTCYHCGDEYPCDTIKVIEKELG
jgi:hypothetical protein